MVWAVIGPDHTVHYRREPGYMDGPLQDVLRNRPKGYWLRRVKTDPEKESKSQQAKSAKTVARLTALLKQAEEAKAARCQHPQADLTNHRQPNDEYVTVCKCGASSDGGPWLYPCDEFCHIDFDSGQPDHSYACEERNDDSADNLEGSK